MSEETHDLAEAHLDPVEDEFDDLIISIEAEESKPLRVSLVGHVYVVRMPKTTLALKLGSKVAKGVVDDPDQMQDLIQDWLAQCMGAEQAALVAERLDDPDDALDFEHVMLLMQKLVEKKTSTPTTSSSGKRTGRSATGKRSTASRRR